MDSHHSELNRSEEPTILDWFQSLLSGDPIPIPEPEESVDTSMAAPPAERERRAPAGPKPATIPARPPLAMASPARLRVPAGLLLALAAQFALEQRAGLIALNAFLYLAGAGLLLWGLIAGDIRLPTLPERIRRQLPTDVRVRPLAIGLLFAVLTFVTASGNQFRGITVLSWLASMVAVFAALWSEPLRPRQWWGRLRGWLRDPRLHLDLGRWHFLLLAGFLVVAYFRFAELTTIPYEMWSDQAEKLLDVRDVLQGNTSIFFPRNSGREAVEFYWAAFYADVLGTGLSFLTLKLVGTTAGFLAIVLTYFFAKELGGRRVGLFASILAGIAFWPNITSRTGLRMPLNELFVAPALFFLVRGLRRGNRNDFLWSGLALGLGLQGYSGFRVMPLVVVLGLVLYLIHASGRETTLQTTSAFLALVLVSVLGALPLLRVLVDMPEVVLYRTLTRVGTVEQAYANPPLLQFFINLWHILTMFSWDNGPIWVVTVPNRPVLDWVSGALFHLGIVVVGYTYLRRRQWSLLFLLLSLPILLLPSALALAFPNENPAPNRVSGAIVPVFTIAAFALDAVYRWSREHLDQHRWMLSAGVVVVLLGVAGGINHRLVFEKYAENQRASAWNNSEAGEVMGGFADSVGSFRNSFFVVYPFWIDSRLVAIEAGAPLRDYSIWPEDLPGQELDPGQYYLYFIKPEHAEAMATLRELHPRGVLSYYSSSVEGRDFALYLVPPQEAPLPASVQELLP